MANENQKAYFDYLSGKAKWVRAVKPDPKFFKWNMALYPYDDDLKKFKTLQDDGVLTRLKKDEEGYYFQLSRPVSKRMRGVEVAFTAPKVMDKDGTILEEGIQVGNGSDVTAKIQVYSYPKPTGGWGKAIRWEALKVINLVPFKSDSFPTQVEKDQVSGLLEQPEPVW